MIRYVNSNQSFARFIKCIEEPLKESRQRCYIGYRNNRVQIESIGEKYDMWLNKVGYKSDYVTITGLLKKE